MVEKISMNVEKISTILFFCKKWGKTFDCFSNDRHVRMESSKRDTKTAVNSKVKYFMWEVKTCWRQC